MLVAVDHVPIRTNPKTRESRLFPSMWAYVRRNALSIFRIYAPYEPLRVFMARGGAASGLAAAVIWARFVWFFVDGDGAGPRPVADPRRGAVHRRRAAGGARRDRRHPRRAARAPAAHARARAARGAAAGRRALALRAGRAAPTGHGAPRRAPTAGARDAARPRSARRCSCEPDGHGDAEAGPTGNTFDKYGSTNPVVQAADGRLPAHARRAVGRRPRPQSVLDVGLRRGRAHRTSGPSGSATAASSASTSTTRSCAPSGRSAGGRTSSTAPRRPTRCPFADDEFDMAAAIEVLEHVPEPEATRRRDGARGRSAGCSCRCRASRSGAG